MYLSSTKVVPADPQAAHAKVCAVNFTKKLKNLMTLVKIIKEELSKDDYDIGQLLCPICKFEYVHYGPVDIKAKDSVFTIPMSCENGHEWELHMNFHKGYTFINYSIRDIDIVEDKSASEMKLKYIDVDFSTDAFDKHKLLCPICSNARVSYKLSEGIYSDSEKSIRIFMSCANKHEWTVYITHNEIAGHSFMNCIINDTTKNEPNTRKRIPENVRHEVWRRDEGKCVKCSSRRNLEFDHIIPVAEGGSNTARNIELLCEEHNRSKGKKV